MLVPFSPGCMLWLAFKILIRLRHRRHFQLYRDRLLSGNIPFKPQTLLKPDRACFKCFRISDCADVTTFHVASSPGMQAAARETNAIPIFGL